MASFAIFNYQFDKIIEHSRQLTIDGMDTVVMSAEEAFPRKQKILGELLDKDYNKATSNDVIHFKNEHGPKEYIHRHLMPPTDDMIIMRVANRKTQTVVDIELKEKKIEDYQNCIVIIDNREGIQRILIENKKTAFSDVKQVANILTYTFNQILVRYSLKIRLDHLQDDRVFWQYVNDRLNYPKGFHKVSFRLPYPNLERLKKTYDRLLNKARESFGTGVNMDFIAPEGGQVRLDENDSYQKETFGWMMNDAGADIFLYNNASKKTPIPVGKNSFRVVVINDSIINRISEDAAGGDLFGSTALDEVKRNTKTGIE